MKLKTTLFGNVYQFKDVKEVLAKANELRSGDVLAGVAAVIFDVVINMAWPILKKKRWLPIVVMLASFVATRFFSVNIIVIILVCGVIGALDTLYLQKKEGAK